MSDSVIITCALIAAVAGIAFGLYLAMWVFKLNAGNAKMQEIAKAIQEGAEARDRNGKRRQHRPHQQRHR